MSSMDITNPSEAYKQATRSLVYRISELMFGSLLAAYSLGFVAAIATHWTEAARHGRLSIVLLIIQYASISLTFAYVTTSLYLTYQTGILTMPQLKLDRLAIDFSLAIFQALFFGFSVLRPWSLPILLGISLGLAGYRQRTEHRALAEELYKVICRPGLRINSQHCEKFRRKLAELVRRDFRELSGWAPTGSFYWFGAGSMFVMGLAIAYLVMDSLPVTLLFRNLWNLRNDPLKREFLITGEAVLLLGFIAFYSHRVLKQRATFFQPWTDVSENDTEPQQAVRQDQSEGEDQAEVDIEFHKLREELERFCTSFSHPPANATNH